MKKCFLYLLIFIFSNNIIAQNNVGIGTNMPNSNAILELFSNNKGLLIPRLTTLERISITPIGSTEEALLVYDISVKNFYYWDGIQWKTISSYWKSDNNIDMYSDLSGNVGIGVNNPTAKLHVNGNIRLEGLNTSTENNVLTIDNLGYLNYRNIPNDIWDGDSDNQTLSLNSNTLNILNGNSVDLSTYLDNTDNQTLSLNSNTLNILNGNSVDLSTYLDNTDNQTLSLNSNTLNILNGNSVDLSTYLDNTDNQTLSLNSNTLNILNGNSVDLSTYLDNTDNQTLSLNSNTLNILNGNSVDLSTYLDNTDNQTLSLNSNTLNILNGNSVDLSTYLDNTDNQTLSLSGNTLSLTNGGSINMSPFMDNTDNQTLTFDNATRNLTISNLGNTVNIPDSDNQTLTYNANTGDLSISNGNTVQVRSSDDDWVIAHPVIYNTSDQVAVGTATPDASAIFQVNSTTQGMLFPTMTTIQRDAIANPAIGLSIFNISTGTHQYWNGTCWLNIGQTKCTDYSIVLSNANACIYTSSASKTTVDLIATLNNFDGIPVILGASGVPSGVSVEFSNNPITPTSSSQITFTGSPAAVPGNYSINIISMNGGDIQSVPFNLQVVGFNYAISGNALTLNEINVLPNTTNGTLTVSVAYNGTCPGGSSIANFSLSGLPPGVTAVFSNNPINGNGSSNITFTSSSCAVVGVYNLTLIADVGGAQLTSPITLTIAKSIINITSNVNDYNLYTAAGSPPCPVDLDCNVQNGIVIGATSTNIAAFNTGAFASGSVITLNNNGTIAGAGGNGGSNLNHNLNNCPLVNGLPGGPALAINTSAILINNNGIIGGGGGGGGTGGGLSAVNLCLDYFPGAGGGGGAGSIVGIGGNDGGSGGCGASAFGANGVLLSGGNGGIGCNTQCNIIFIGSRSYDSGNGGRGGDLGQNGADGLNPNGFALDNTVCSPGSGGAAGAAIIKNGNQIAPSSVLGDVRGTVVP
jgi:hypothetical protein